MGNITLSDIMWYDMAFPSVHPLLSHFLSLTLPLITLHPSLIPLLNILFCFLPVFDIPFSILVCDAKMF